MGGRVAENAFKPGDLRLRSDGMAAGERLVYAAAEELLRRAALHRTTGPGYIRVDFVQGGVAAVKIGIEENFKPTT